MAAGNAAIGYRGNDLARASEQPLDPARPRSTARSRSCRARRMPRSLPCPITRRRLWPASSPRAAPAASCVSPRVFPNSERSPDAQLTRALLDNAGDLPFFGPNCYGFVNFFDRAALLPDQVVGLADRAGRRLDLPERHHRAHTELQRALGADRLSVLGRQSDPPRGRGPHRDLCATIRASRPLGLYLEGIKDAERFARAADMARRAGKPIAVVKSGRTAAAARTAHSHTGALAGADSVFEAFCRQAGLARCDTLGHAVRDAQAVSYRRSPRRAARC